MKTFLETVIVAFSMYSKIPMPRVEWTEKNMRFSLVFFPMVGAVIAVLLYFLFFVFTLFSFSPILFGAVAVLVPILITGGLHLDGYCDTVDALCSRQNQAEKLRILKDPHVGAFAVIYTAAILILQFGAWCQIFQTPDLFPVLLFSFVFSRALASLALLSFPCSRSTGLAFTFAQNSSRWAVQYILLCMIIVCWAAMFHFAIVAASIILLLVLCSYLWFYFMTRKHFGGLTGDLAGFYIVFCETLVLFASAFIGGMGV